VNTLILTSVPSYAVGWLRPAPWQPWRKIGDGNAWKK
jgi:hypothetical protein